MLTCHLTFILASTLSMNLKTHAGCISSVTIFSMVHDLVVYTRIQNVHIWLLVYNRRFQVCTVEMGTPTVLGCISEEADKHSVCL